MKRILIVDFSLYKNALRKTFQDEGYSVVLCENAFDAIARLKSMDFDLIVSEVELPGDNSFDLYNYITRHYPYIPTIMTTEKSIDTFFDRIFEEGIGNVLCKPVRKDELLSLAQKLITKKNIFGLHNYIAGLVETKKIRITSSRQIKKAISAVLGEIEAWGFPIENRMALNLVLDEMAINAVYHSHGLTREKEGRIPVTLPEGGFVDIFFARSADRYGIAIDDYNGKLSKEIILNSIRGVIEQTRLIERAAETGEDISSLITETGRGLDLLRKLFADYYFIMKQNVRTEIILLFYPSFRIDDTDAYSSLKIIEDLTPE